MIGETPLQTDERFMRQALLEAMKGAEENEVPIGAVIVSNGRVIARAHNQTEALKDVTAHAEILAITAASEFTGGKYLPDCTLYVTVEPCIMCAGAIGWAQIGRLVYGAPDPKRGSFSAYHPVKSPLHPKTIIEEGILKEECADIISQFFKNLRR